MYTNVNARGEDLVPGYKEGYNLQQFAPFFIFYIVFGSLYLMSLFIGVVIQVFNKESERLGKNFLLT